MVIIQSSHSIKTEKIDILHKKYPDGISEKEKLDLIERDIISNILIDMKIRDICCQKNENTIDKTILRYWRHIHVIMIIIIIFYKFFL